MPQVALGRPATYEDLVAVADNLVAEIVDGELWASPRPAPRHARSQSRLVALLEPPFDQGRGGPGGWVILAEPELHLSSDVLVPGLAGWRRERMPRLPDTAHFSLGSFVRLRDRASAPGPHRRRRCYDGTPRPAPELSSRWPLRRLAP